MLSNAVYPALDPATPAVLSSKVIGGLLRGQLGFSGVTISDTLSAPGVASASTAVRAAKAGVDILLYTDEAVSARAYSELLGAARAGQISTGALKASAARIHQLGHERRPATHRLAALRGPRLRVRVRGLRRVERQRRERRRKPRSRREDPRRASPPRPRRRSTSPSRARKAPPTTPPAATAPARARTHVCTGAGGHHYRVDVQIKCLKITTPSGKLLDRARQHKTIKTPAKPSAPATAAPGAATPRPTGGTGATTTPTPSSKVTPTGGTTAPRQGPTTHRLRLSIRLLTHQLGP